MPPFVPYLIAAGIGLVAYWWQTQRQKALPPPRPRARPPAPGMPGSQFVGPPAPPGTPASQPGRHAQPVEDSPPEVVHENGKTYFEGPYDPATAARLAPTLVVDLSDHSVSKEDTLLIRAFQAAAGIRVDGKYGPISKGALRYWLRAGGSQVEPPAADGSGEKTYSPPDGHKRLPEEQVMHPAGGSERDNWPAVTKCDHQGAAIYAPIVAQYMRVGKAYKQDDNARRALRSFQLAAGIAVDEDYGPESYWALAYWLRAAGSNLSTPRAIFKGSAKGYTPCAAPAGSAMSI